MYTDGFLVCNDGPAGPDRFLLSGGQSRGRIRRTVVDVISAKDGGVNAVEHSHDDAKIAVMSLQLLSTP